MVRIPGPGGNAPGGGGGASVTQTCTPVNDAASEVSQAISCTGVTAGHVLVIGGVIGSTATALGVTDGAGSTWTCQTPAGTSVASVISFSCYTLNELGSGSVTATLSWTTSTFVLMTIFEVAGVTAFDKVAGSTAVAGTSWTWPGVTNTASGLTFACGGHGISNNTYTAGTGYTLPANGQVSGGGQSAMCQYKPTSSGSETPTATGTTSTTLSQITISFK